MLTIKNISETYGMQVFTDDGGYFGDVEEVVLALNKISGWKIKATRGSMLSKSLSGAKGVIVPHSMVKSIGDIMIVAKAALPILEETA